MILLIDNYDSFSYNLYQLLGTVSLERNPEAAPDIKVIRNDEFSASEIIDLKPERIVLSPGPGRPEHAGVCENLLKELSGNGASGRVIPIPLLGVCLGHQAICEVFGAKVTYAKEIMHGKPSDINVDQELPIFEGLPPIIKGARYHSLAAERDTIPEELIITAWTKDGEVMGVMHESLPIYGVQFHPESILTPLGNIILENFLSL
jgi:anthranilate synthase component 2